MGAWIEITHESHRRYEHDRHVAPFMGAWIEITGLVTGDTLYNVAPFMGAWIEMYVRRCCHDDWRSRTLHGCVD